MRECEAVARRAGLLVLPLHGDLSPEEQDRAVSPSPQRKLILATNVAESSVTVEGVTAVIDSGLARVATYSPWTGLPTLHLGRVSKASAKQRAGRAGRTGPGKALRLYSEEDYLLRANQETPEILRSDLSQLCLALRAMQIYNTNTVDWLDAPPMSALQNAESLLDRLGATGKMVDRLARYPLSPRLSRILVEAIHRGVGEDGCAAVALLESETRSEKSDLLDAMESRHDYRTVQHIEQLRRIARPSKQLKHDDDALLISVLAGFPDRVARRRAGNQVRLPTGVSAEIAGEPPVYEFMVAIDAEDRKDKPVPLVRTTSRVEPEWLIDLFPDRVREQSNVTWNRVAERVEAVSTLLYDDLVIQESQDTTPETEAAADLLCSKALEVGIERFVDGDSLEQLRARVEFAGLTQPDIAQALRELCSGLRSFADLKGEGLRSPSGAKDGFKASQGTRSCERSVAEWASDQDSLQWRQAPLDSISPSGLLRDARHSAYWSRPYPAGSTPACAEPKSCADHDRPRRILGETLSTSATRTDAPISQTFVARRSII